MTLRLIAGGVVEELLRESRNLAKSNAMRDEALVCSYERKRHLACAFLLTAVDRLASNPERAARAVIPRTPKHNSKQEKKKCAMHGS